MRARKGCYLLSGRVAGWVAGRRLRTLATMEKPRLDRRGSDYDFLLRRPSAILETQFEEAILQVGAATSPLELRLAVTSALHTALPDVVCSLVLLLDAETKQLAYFETNESLVYMPTSGVVWDSVKRRSLDTLHSAIPSSDPIYTVHPGLPNSLKEGQVVVVVPVSEAKGHQVVALMLAVCSKLLSPHDEKLQWLKKNMLVASQRVIKHAAAEKERKRAEGMLRVCGDLIDLDTSILSLKIHKHLKSILGAKASILLIVDEVTNEFICQTFDDVALDIPCTLPMSETLYGRCVESGSTFVIDNVAEDMRYNPAVDTINNYEPYSMICMPVQVQREGHSTPDTIAVAVAFDKAKEKGGKFTSRDEENMSFVLRFSSTVLANTLAYQREMLLRKHNTALLEMARNLFSSVSDQDKLFRAVMNEAKKLTNAERCSVFLLDPHGQELVASVFDGAVQAQSTVRIAVGQGIAGFVAKTGEIVNIKDAYKHPKFFKEIDITTGFHTRNILCFPIKNNIGDVVGVAELCNKVGGKFFTKYDQELAATFSVYCGISLYHSNLYHELELSRTNSKLSTELMLYHMQVSGEDVHKLAAKEIAECHQFSNTFATFTYSPRSIPDTKTPEAVISMCAAMGLIQRWKLKPNTLAKFVLMVKRSYRDPPYHNWYHALSVAHFCYVLYQHCSHLSFLTDLEVLSLFFSCLCHDIDHRGTNNSFQISSKSALASLYSSEGSVMERHHFAQTLCILNSEGCNIFESLNSEEYKKVLDLIQSNILDTDIATHLRKMKDMQQMGKDGFDASSNHHHKLMCSLIMTSCDISDTCKEWDTAKSIADMIYTEFFTQGDLEKALGSTPSEMMDRDRAFIPAQQIGFMDSIAAPVFKVLGQVLPSASAAYSALSENRQRWEELKKEGRKSP